MAIPFWQVFSCFRRLSAARLTRERFSAECPVLTRAVILVELHIQHPMQIVLHRPVPAHKFSHLLRRHVLMREQIIPSLLRASVSKNAPCLPAPSTASPKFS